MEFKQKKNEYFDVYPYLSSIEELTDRMPLERFVTAERTPSTREVTNMQIIARLSENLQKSLEPELFTRSTLSIHQFCAKN